MQQPKQSKLFAYLSTLICGYILHLYAFTNIVPNSDGLNRVYDIQNMTVSGRWFLQYATLPNGYTQMPTFIGLLTLCFLGLSAVLVVDMLEIKSPKIAIMVGLLTASFPSMGYTFLYLFTASAYSIGIFLAILCPWFAKKGGVYRIFGVISLSLSMGIYQAYAPLAIALSLILVLQFSLKKEETPKTILSYGLPYLLVLFGGAVLYYIILQLILMVTGQELLQYLGMSQGYPLSSIPSLILSSYKQVLIFFFLPTHDQGTTTVPLALCNLVALGIGGVSLLLHLKKRKEGWRLPVALLFCAMIPLAIGFGQVISPWSAPTPLMQFPYVCVYFLVLALAEPFWEKKPIYSRGLVALSLLITLSGGWICNLLYTASAQAHRATESYATRLYTRIESVPGYHSDLPIYIIGGFPKELYYSQIESYQIIDHYSAPRDTLLDLNKHVYYYFNHWLNIPIPEPTEADLIAMSNSIDFQAMPCYPDDGSIAIIDGVVVAKIDTEYTPKSDYEIAYENRK